MIRILLATAFRAMYVLAFFFLLAYGDSDIYEFPEPQPFHGNNWYNPYANLDSNHWKLGNFHAHCNVYCGLTDGTGSIEELYHTYFNRMNYDVLGVSNYQQVEAGADGIRKIRTYEHGYSPTKNHHIVIGTDKVSWMEYPLFQHRQHKQHVLTTLHNTDSNAVIAIAHPKRGDAYSLEDMRYLSHYNLVEAFNHLSTSKIHWDAALSAGKPVFLLANDDAHDHEDVFKCGRMATLFYAPELNEKQLVNALKAGQSIGVEIFTDYDESFAMHKQKVLHLEKIEHLKIVDDTLQVKFNNSCDSIIFVGQNGEVKQIVNDTASAHYALTAEDTYIRIETVFDGTLNRFFLNPVFRTTGEKFVMPRAVKNTKASLIYRSTFIFCLLLLSSLIGFWEYRRWKKAKRTA